MLAVALADEFASNADVAPRERVRLMPALLEALISRRSASRATTASLTRPLSGNAFTRPYDYCTSKGTSTKSPAHLAPRS